MIITRNILDEKVPKQMIPTRLDSVMNLYTNVSYKDETGIIVHNTNPATWNCLYSFYELNHKFTIDEYNFGKEDITYRELIEEYQKVHKEIYEDKKENIKNIRKQILIDEYKKTFNLKSVHISDELLPIFELKYSKSKLYEPKILPLDSSVKELDGVALVSNIPYLLSVQYNVEKLNNNLMKGEK